METGETLTVEESLSNTPLGTRQVLSRKMPLRDGSGHIVGILGASLDIAERKRAEEMLREIQKNLTLAQGIAHIGSWKYTLKTGELYWSDELFRIYGLNPEKTNINLDHSIGMIHPDDKAFAEETFGRAVKEGVPYEFEYRIIRPDGEERFMQAIGNIEKDENGDIVSLYGTGQDITERKRAEEALRQSEERFRGVFGTSPTGIAIVDTVTQRFLEANVSFLRIVGYSREELQLLTVMDVTHPDDWEKEAEVVRAYLNGELPSYVVVKRYIRKDGEIRWVRITGDVLRIQPDEPPLAIANVEDITERKRAEEELQQYREHLRCNKKSRNMSGQSCNYNRPKRPP